MLGFLKKRITLRDLGAIITKYSHSFISADAGRSIGILLDAAGDRESIEAADRIGIDKNLRRYFVHLYFLYSIDAACSDFDEHSRNSILEGAIDCFNMDGIHKEILYNGVNLARSTAIDIDFVDKYIDTKEFQNDFLEHRFIVPCYSLAILDYFQEGALVEFASDRDRLDGFCAQFGSSVATAHRANTQASKIYRLR